MFFEDRLRSHTPASGVCCSMHENMLSVGPHEPAGPDSFALSKRWPKMGQRRPDCILVQTFYSLRLALE